MSGLMDKAKDAMGKAKGSGGGDSSATTGGSGSGKDGEVNKYANEG